MADFDGLGLALAAAGSLSAYAGIKGYSIPHALQSFITGQAPTGAPQYPISGQQAASGAQGAVYGSSAVNDFLGYVGKVPYAWGKASPATGWDCSGSCNYVLCHDAGLPIPEFGGGQFTGTEHGPSTFAWLPWARANLQPLSRGQAQAGDLVLWLTHMGVVTDGTSYVSAYDEQQGTAVNSIDTGGPTGESPSFWRYGTPAARGGAAPPPVH